MRREKTELVPVMVRLPESLRSQLETEAKEAGRSMNKEIIARLQASLQQDITEQRHKEIIARLEALETREDRAAAGYRRTALDKAEEEMLGLRRNSWGTGRG